MTIYTSKLFKGPTTDLKFKYSWQVMAVSRERVNKLSTTAMVVDKGIGRMRGLGRRVTGP